MKKVLIFMGLKIVEMLGVAGIFFIPYGTGILWIYIGSPFPKQTTHFDRFMTGFIFYIGLLVLSGIGYGIYYWAKMNWDWADKITKGGRTMTPDSPEVSEKGVRKPLKQFAEFQEAILKGKDWKKHWSGIPVTALLKMLKAEVDELSFNIGMGEFVTGYMVLRECADVANFAMMIYDNINKQVIKQLIESTEGKGKGVNK